MMKPQYRHELLTAIKHDESARTITVAFSSETPVQRERGLEILDHSEASIRLKRLKDGAPVLLDHDPRSHVGVVQNVMLGSDRIARAEIRFSQSKRAQAVFRDVCDGIKRHLSVGYFIHKIEPQKESGTYRAIDWEPFEISFVAIPADPTVGVGRDFLNTLQEKSMSENEKKEISKIDTHTDVTSKTSDDARVREITALGELSNAPELATRMIETNLSIEQARAFFVDHMKQKNKTSSTDSLSIDFSEKEKDRYSLIRALRASVTNNWKNAGFEREVSLKIAQTLQREPQGFFMPLTLPLPTQRMQQAGQPELGGHLVATELLSSSFIDVLRNVSILPSLGATVLSNLQGHIDIPKQLTSSSFWWVSEDGAPTESDLNFGQVELRPRTIAGAVSITRKLMKQSSLDVEYLVRRDLALGVALAIDKAAFTGSGKNEEPWGILNRPEISSLTYETTPSFNDVVDLETAVNSQNALLGNLAYIGHTHMTGLLKTTEIAPATAQFLLRDQQVNGYRYVGSNQLPHDTLLFGDFSSILIGLWGVLDIVPDVATKAQTGGLVIRVFQDVDFNLRYNQSFAMLKKTANKT